MTGGRLRRRSVVASPFVAIGIDGMNLVLDRESAYELDAEGIVFYVSAFHGPRRRPARDHYRSSQLAKSQY